MTERRPYDVVIVGAGIVGTAVALACAQEHLTIAIVEPDVVGGGATAAGMGHIVVMDDSEAQFSLTHYSQQLWQTIAPELPRDVEYMPCGTIWVAVDQQEMQEVRRKHEYYGSRGVTTEILDEPQLREAEAGLRPGLAGGLLVPGDSVIYSPYAARFFLQRAQAGGADLYSGVRAVKLRQHDVVLSDGRRLATTFIVNAAGTWAREFTPGLEVRKRKGHLVITDRYPGHVRHQLVELGYLKSAHSLTAESVAFNVQPRMTGQLLIGSSRQFGAESSEVDRRILCHMLQRAFQYLPGLSRMSAIRAWAGFRAATPDKLPLIGKSPAQDNVYLATGHEGLGITTSLGTARLLVDQLLNRRSQIPVEPYLPTRHMEPAHA
jgi:glycine/D-amino acid oxidase-like deaminating enzyme